MQRWHKVLSELRSMSLALPGARHMLACGQTGHWKELDTVAAARDNAVPTVKARETIVDRLQKQ